MSTLTFPTPDYRGAAIWSNDDSDLPVSIVSYIGEEGGERFFECTYIEPRTGIQASGFLPASQLQPVIPDALTKLRQWVCWRAEERDGRKTKVPYQPNGRHADSTNPQTWSDFVACQLAARNPANRFDGIGIVLANGLVGIDIDHCIDDSGNLSDFAQSVVHRLNTYTEITPSGKGLHLLLWGTLPNGKRRDDKLGIEMYDRARFFTVTGEYLAGTPHTVERRDAEISQLHQEIFGTPIHAETSLPPTDCTPSNLDDDELLAKARAAKNGDKFERLWRGDTSDYNGDDSRADLALCEMLAFWTGKDAVHIDRLFRQSGLMRPKWDEKRGAKTYGQITIERALASCQGTYTGGVSYVAQSLDVWLPTSEVVEALGRGEVGDAELFARLYADKVCFDHSEKSWYLWRGHFWERDRKDEVVGLVANGVAAQYLAAAATKRKDGHTELADKLTERAKLLRYRNKINNVLALAQSQPALAITGVEWDRATMLLGVSNGVLDLKTGELRAGQPRDYIRTSAPTEWRGIDEPAPRWEQFLQEIFAGDTELIAFVQRLFGYALTGLATEHVFPVLWGEGRNGKETLIEVIKYVLGDLANPVPADVLLHTKRDPNAPTPHLLALRGLRLAWVSENNEGVRLNSSQVKWLTGGGTIVARPLYGAPVTFRPQYLLMLITNHKPHASADDYALWQRLRLIPFTQRFVDQPSAPNEHPRDKKLGEKLHTEASGILAWLVGGCLEWQQRGLDAPNVVHDATDGYRNEEDEIGLFLDECTTRDHATTTKAGELYDAYRQWCISVGLAPMSGTTFGKRLAARGFVKERLMTGIVYRGIRLVM